MARLLVGACRHFEYATVALLLLAFAPTGRTYIVEIKVLNRIKDETIQCLGHWFVLEPCHSSESENRIAAYLGNVCTSFCFGVHYLHLH